MRIILTQAEIEEAIEKLILDQVEIPEDMRIDIALKATRGDEGYTAEVDIVMYDAPNDGSDRSVDPRLDIHDGAETLGIAEKVMEAKQKALLPRRRGRPEGARNKPKLSQDHRTLPGSGTEQAEGQAQTETTADETAPEVAQEPIQEGQEIISEPKVAPEPDLVEQMPDEAPTEPEEEVLMNEPIQEEPLVNQEEDIQVEPELDYTPTPETAPEPAPAAPTRSLFSHFTRG